jgi:Fe2+ transport system protein FeoA
MRTAANLKFGGKVKIKDNDTLNASCIRILKVSFTPGEEIKVITRSAFDDPITFSVSGKLAAIRKKEVIKNYGSNRQTLI